ncbi:alkaline phosphatase [Tahibacter amnicola]|uniref:Alkaline phosphatase n=1 Tax=Tahibacter amnicola TaxID=2976241 RepID=A0ABY6BEF2_9GAMM|nr:alkaline phosphatase [Tahibacter amnicola]UXI68162.1 alkaline phosphatase [Tahibacter amnicola]
MRTLRPAPLALALLLSACASQPTADRAGHPGADAAAGAIEVPSIARPSGETAAWWFTAGAATAHAHLGPKAPRARNVIVFLGDGMSIPTIAAAHILAGQLQGKDGESHRLSFETLPYTALSRTYETDSQTPDSAGTMSAIMTGAKTKSGFISIGQAAERADCASSKGQELVTAVELAEAAGMATGAVTTARITHATPAATYGHLPEREWEVDAAMPDAAKAQGCTDFARQLVEFPVGDGLDVALGGGRTAFIPASQRDPEHAGTSGQRKDERDLIAQWQQRDGAVYVWNKEQMAALESAPPRQVLGLFEPSHLLYEHDRATDKAGEPSLAEMTRTAITLLKRNPKGYFLMVEGGRIDHAHHAGNAYRALTDTIAFADAVKVAMDETSVSDTLIVVTADHAHTMSFAGYPVRGNPILGLVRGGSDFEGAGSDLAKDQLGLPYTTLSYANGPGYFGATDRQPAGPKKFPHGYTKASVATVRPDLSGVDTQAPDYLQEATLPMRSESHGGEDVAIFARGPGAYAFHGELEQNVIFHIIAQSAPVLRAQLCKMESCDKNGVPTRLPSYERLRGK